MRPVNYLGFIVFFLVAPLASAYGEAEPVSLAKPVSLTKTEREDIAVASGHFSRARSLIIEAIREFDKGYKLSDPSALLEVAEWRSTLIDRAEELERVLDPQPRASSRGIIYNGDRRLLNTSKK